MFAKLIKFAQLFILYPYELKFNFRRSLAEQNRHRIQQGDCRQAENQGVPLLGSRLDRRQHPRDAWNVQATLHPRLQRNDPPGAAGARPRPIHRQGTPPNNRPVNYASLIFRISQVYRRTEENFDAELMQIKGCDFDCPLDKFKELTAPVRPVDWRAECQAESEDFVPPPPPPP